MYYSWHELNALKTQGSVHYSGKRCATCTLSIVKMRLFRGGISTAGVTQHVLHLHQSASGGQYGQSQHALYPPIPMWTVSPLNSTAPDRQRARESGVAMGQLECGQHQWTREPASHGKAAAGPWESRELALSTQKLWESQRELWSHRTDLEDASHTPACQASQSFAGQKLC